MSDEQLTLLLNGKEYALSEELKAQIEQRAENEFSENEFLDYYWGENERGDPTLYIETRGEWVPADRLEQLDFEMEEVEQSDGDDDSDDTEEVDAGNGMKTVPRDDVTMRPDDPTDDEDVPDPKFMVTHPSKTYIPQPEQDDPETVPPHPDELPEDPSLVAWIPEGDCTEVWETGRAIVPLSLTLQWNLQKRADEVPEGAMKVVAKDDGSMKEIPKTSRHDDWELMMEQHECEVVAEKKPSDTPPADNGGGYQGKEADDTLDGKYGGDNWNI